MVDLGLKQDGGLRVSEYIRVRVKNKMVDLGLLAVHWHLICIKFTQSAVPYYYCGVWAVGFDRGGGDRGRDCGGAWGVVD